MEYETRLDPSGKLVLPKAVREAAGIRGGMAVLLRSRREGGLEVIPLHRVRKGEDPFVEWCRKHPIRMKGVQTLEDVAEACREAWEDVG